MTGSADPAWPDDAIEVGRIVGAWGVKGWFKVLPHSADPQALFSSKRWFLKPPENPVGPASIRVAPLLRVIAAREHGDVVVAQAQEVADRPAAEALKGAHIFVARSSFPTADAGEFYWVDLIGLQVINREGAVLGTVAGLIDTGPHSVLRVVPSDVSAVGKAEDLERLIPFVDAYIDAVSLPEQRIAVDWGLDY